MAAQSCSVEGGGSPCAGSTGVASLGNQGGTSVGAGNPINLISGNKYQREEDLPALPGVLGLEIVRHYNSAYSTPNITPGILGRGWKLSYETTLYATGAVIQIIQADGTRIMFTRNVGQPSLCATDNPANGELQISRTDQGENYLWTWPNGKTLQFDQDGHLVQIAVPTGEFVSLQYDAKGVLVQVTDPQRRQLKLHYPTKKEASHRVEHVANIASPVGNFTYRYGSLESPNVSAANKISDTKTTTTASTVSITQKKLSSARHAALIQANLIAVQRPAGGASRLYHYEDTLRPTFLTGISIQSASIDSATGAPAPKRIGTYLYDQNGRAVLSVGGTPARLQTDTTGKPLQPARLAPGTGIGQVTLDYTTPGVTVLTNSLGQQSTYRHTIIAGRYRLLEARGAGCGQCGEMNVRYGYDRLGRQTILTHLSPEGEPLSSRQTQYDAQSRVVQVSITPYDNGKTGPPRWLVRYEYGLRQVAFAADAKAPASTATAATTPTTTFSPTLAASPTAIIRPSIVPGKEHRLDITYNQQTQATQIKESGFRPLTTGNTIAQGNTIQGTQATNATAIERTTTYRYQTINGRSLLKEVDGSLKNGPRNAPADSDITRYSWDGKGSVLQQITYPGGQIARFAYDLEPLQNQMAGSKRLVRSTGIDSVVTKLTYDPQGLVTQVNRGGAITHYRYDSAGHTTQAISPIGERLRFDYHDSRHISAILDQQNNKIALLRDTEGRLKQASLYDPAGTLAQQPQRFSDATSQAKAANDTNSKNDQKRSNDPNGISDPLRDPVLAGVRALINAAQTVEANNDNSGNNAGNLARPQSSPPFAIVRTFVAAAESASQPLGPSATVAADTRGNLTTYTTDDFGNLVQTQSPTTGTTTYQYNLAGQLVGKRQGDGSHVTYDRDPAGRVIALKAYGVQGHLDENASITWGRANKPTAIRYLAGAETFAYDDTARLIAHTQTIDGKTRTLTYRYNSAGQLLAKTLPDGQQLTYRYRGTQHPKAGLLESVWLAGVNNPTAQTLSAGIFDRPIIEGMNIQTDRYAQRRVTFGNGLTNDTTLDQQGRVVAAGNAQVGQTRLEYHLTGASAGTVSHAKDDSQIDQYLAEPTKVTITHPILLGQRAQEQAAQALISRLYGVAASWHQASLNQPDVVSVGVALPNAPPHFDAIGRQVNQGATHYTYDSLNRLTGIDRATANAPDSALTTTNTSTLQEVARYRYNLFGQRIAKTVALANGKSTKTTHYFYDGSHLVFEASDQDTPTKQYVWLNDKPIAMLQNGSILAIHTDHRNAPIALTDEARQVVWQAKVGDYLHSTAVQNRALGTITFNLRGSNQYFDAESGLHYNTQRYFDPIAARYLSPDPLGLAMGPDLYAFALDRPHTLADPLGLQPVPATDWSKASYNEKFGEIVKRAIPQVPGEIGAALLELVQPENVVAVGIFITVFAIVQATPIGWVADAILLGLSINAIGEGTIELLKGLLVLHEGATNAKCESDLDAAAKMLANKLVAAAGGIGGGAAGVTGVAKSGGITRIAKGIEDVIALGKNRLRTGVPANAGVISTTGGITNAATIEEAAAEASKIVPGGGLAAHEYAGGHLIDRHVGLSKSDLATRLASDSKISAASTFTNRAVAEVAVATVLDSNVVAIQSFLSGSANRLVLNGSLPNPIGISLSRGAVSPVSVFNVTVVLQRDASMVTGYRIVTGYPKP